MLSCEIPTTDVTDTLCLESPISHQTPPHITNQHYPTPSHHQEHNTRLNWDATVVMWCSSLPDSCTSWSILTVHTTAPLSPYSCLCCSRDELTWLDLLRWTKSVVARRAARGPPWRLLSGVTLSSAWSTSTKLFTRLSRARLMGEKSDKQVV